MNPARAQLVTGPILNPRPGGVDFIKNGAIACDEAGVVTFVGLERDLPRSLAQTRKRAARGIVCPPFIDDHIHIPQHPVRGHFMDGIGANPDGGRLLAGLNRNVFPAEAKCADVEYARACVDAFARDTLAKGVVGGSAYMTVHENATHVALERLSSRWFVGLVLMEMNCPEYLRVDRSRVMDQMTALEERFHRRFVVTDRFAVAVGTDLRKRAARFAWDRGLNTQTHLNEQLAEKRFVERTLYPTYDSYTDVYLRDGLLDMHCTVAHCIHMTPAELDILVERVKITVAHCPTSNTLLCSGVMPLDEVVSRGIYYSICTDVGASPTTSMLAEMAQFLKVHAGRSKHATPGTALDRVCPGWFEPGREMSFIEVQPSIAGPWYDADDAILRGLLGLTPADLDRYARPGDPYHTAREHLASGTLDGGSNLQLLEADVRATAARLEDKVVAVTLNGEEVFRRDAEPVV